MRHVQLSESLALGTAERLHRVGVLPAPATDLAYACTPGRCPRGRCARRDGPRRTTTRPPSGSCWTASAGTTPSGPDGLTARTPRGRGECGCGARRDGCHHAATAAQRRRSRTSNTGRAGRRRRSSWPMCARTPCPSTRSSPPCATRAPGHRHVRRRVREHDHGAAVDALDYSAHPSAPGGCGTWRRRSPTTTGHRAAAVHRVGHLEVGDLAVVVAVSAAHRGAALTAAAS